MSVKRVWIVLFIAIVLLAAAMGPRAAARPPVQEAAGATIPYAGHLAIDEGQALAEGAYDLRFELYATQAGGDPLWTETQARVAVRGGAFGVVLGSVQPIPKDLLEGGVLWLAVGVRGPGEVDFTLLEPRQRLSAAPLEVTVASSCAHDHMGEWWTGSSSSAGLVVDNRTGTGDGVRGYANAAAADYGGVYGVNSASGPGVYGRSDAGGPGVAGYSAGRGVYGRGADGVVGESNTATMSGVYGFNTVAGGYGVTGRADNYFGVFAWGDDETLYDRQGDLLLRGTYGEIFAYSEQMDFYSNNHVIFDLDDDNNSTGAFFRILSGSDSILWTVSETMGNAVSAGSQASAVPTSDGSQRLMYSIQGTGVWLEDVGTAALVDGEAVVGFDAVYAQVASLGGDYQVFITAQSDQPVLLYVAAKAADAFTVRGVTLDGKPATCTFDYRVIAERAGYQGVRTEVFDTASPKGEQ